MQNDELLYLYICLEYFSREREKEKKYEGVREKREKSVRNYDYTYFLLLVHSCLYESLPIAKSNTTDLTNNPHT